MRHAIIPLVFAALAGIATALQPGVNARAAKAFGDRIHGGVLNFAIGLIAMLAVFVIAKLLVSTPNPNFTEAYRGPWWMWGGGLLGAFFVTTAIFVMPIVGSGAYITMMVAGQIVTSIVIDQFGLMGLKQSPITLPKALGLLLVIAGVALVMWSRPASPSVK